MLYRNNNNELMIYDNCLASKMIVWADSVTFRAYKVEEESIKLERERETA